jgi:hypothetical protein
MLHSHHTRRCWFNSSEDTECVLFLQCLLCSAYCSLLPSFICYFISHIAECVNWWSWKKCLLFGRNCCNRGKLFLLFLWSDTWLVSEKSCSTWRRVVQFQPGAEKWQLLSTLSVNLSVQSSVLYSHSALPSKWYKVYERLWYRLGNQFSAWFVHGDPYRSLTCSEAHLQNICTVCNFVI